jgi:hypothetical protein
MVADVAPPMIGGPGDLALLIAVLALVAALGCGAVWLWRRGKNLAEQEKDSM